MTHVGHHQQARRRAPARPSARRPPGVMSVSSRPWITSVGAVTRRQRRRPRPRGVDGGQLAGARPPGRSGGRSACASALACARSRSKYRREHHTAASAARGDVRRLDRSAVGSAARPAPRAVGAPCSGSPVMDMTRDQRRRPEPGARWPPSGRSCRPSRPPGRGPGRCRGGRAGRRRRPPCRTACTGTGGGGWPASAAPMTGGDVDLHAVERRRQPAVAVVEADDVAPAVGQRRQKASSHEMSWAVKPMTRRRAGSSGEPKVSYSSSIPPVSAALGMARSVAAPPAAGQSARTAREPGGPGERACTVRA